MHLGTRASLWRAQRAFQFIFSLLIAVSYGVLFFNQLTFGLEMDEAINLTVVKNFAEGYGYSTNSVSSGEIDFREFDPTVSTGPTMLAPSALVWNVTDGNLALTRLVPLGYFVLYLGALFLVVKRLWGVTAGLIALSMPLLLNVGGPDLLTHGLSIGRFIGEFALVALTFAAILLLMRRSYIAASIILGLAGLTKLNWLLVSLAILVTWFALMFLRDRTYRIATWVLSALSVFVPIVVFEGYKLIVLGLDGYRSSLAGYQAWLDGQGKGVISQYLGSGEFTWVEKIVGIATSPIYQQRLLDLFGLVSGYGLLLVLLGFLVLAGGTLVNRKPESIATPETTLEPDREQRALVTITLSISAVLFILWWLVGMSQDSARVGLPFWLLIGPLLGVAVYRGTQSFSGHLEGGKSRFLLQIPLAVLLAGAIGVQAWTMIKDDSGRELLQQQTEGARLLIELNVDELPRNGFWSNPELQVLVDRTSMDHSEGRFGSVLAFTSVQALLEKGSADARVYEDTCGQILYTSQALLICQP